MLSEEEEEPIILTAGAPLALAIDPLDGSSNIAINSPIGTIFGIYPAEGCSTDKSFLRRGRHLLAAGYVIYGARTEMVISAGGPPRLYVLSGKRDAWHFVRECRIPESAHEFAINVSNYRRWPEQVRVFVDLCLDGREGPLNEDYNMRWLAALVGETHRILLRGGVFFYPATTARVTRRGVCASSTNARRSPSSSRMPVAQPRTAWRRSSIRCPRPITHERRSASARASRWTVMPKP